MAQELISLGFKAITICVKADVLSNDFIGKTIDHEFLSALPPDVDPCGENGEFHTFCYDGPIFNQPIPFTIVETVFRDYRTTQETLPTKENIPYGFWYCDLKPD